MLKIKRERLNRFLVDAFNSILRQEELALSSGSFTDLSVKEYHVIEAAVSDEKLTMSAVSKKLGITVGSLTVAAKTLEKKGYLLREKSIDDKRMVYVVPTALGLQANTFHGDFHKKMVDSVVEIMPEEELESLASALGIIAAFFSTATDEL